jgi:LysM repeat protein
MDNKRLKFFFSTFLMICFFSTTALWAQEKMTRQQYIDKYKDIALEQMKSHGIPASITLAQGCLESGDGNSPLAKEANNHFGIKCHNDWKGPSMRLDDDQKDECFRKYKKASDSYDDHGDFLRGRDRYSSLFDLKITDYKGWAYGLKKAGYATNPQYAQMLIKIIEDYGLYKYDSELAGKALKEKGLLPPSPAQLEALIRLKPAKHSPLYKYSLNRTLYVQNNVAYVIANEGDTYKSIGEEYNLFPREILRFNDVKNDCSLSSGTIVYIQKKKCRAKRHLDVHIAEDGDTYYAISQRYAVRLSKILKYNKVKSSDSPKEGDAIYLRSSKY